MNKLIVLIFSAALDLTGDSKGYTAGSTTYASVSGSKDSTFGAIFAEIDLGDTPFSFGVEYVPFDADISLDGKGSSKSANVDNFATAYLMASKELDNGANVYLKAGASMADIGSVKTDSDVTVNSQSSSLDGLMVGLGFETPESDVGLKARAEATYTEFDTIDITTTSNGSTSVKKEADGDLVTVTISLAKSF